MAFLMRPVGLKDCCLETVSLSGARKLPAIKCKN